MSEKLDNAIIYATKQHKGQVRKREGTPYILHPLETAAIAYELTKDEDVVIAAILHDTVEDTDATIEDIENLFGPRVAELVASETENKRYDLPPEETWEIRKKESLDHLKNTNDPAVKILWLSDKLSNIRTIMQIYREIGDEVWQNFNMKDISKQAWYYRTIKEYLKDLDNTIAYLEYSQMVDYIFREH